jgi:hypothetical protein
MLIYVTLLQKESLFQWALYKGTLRWWQIIIWVADRDNSDICIQRWEISFSMGENNVFESRKLPFLL